MTSVWLSNDYSPCIRLLDTHRDLSAVADLIEICFEHTLDDDGLQYVSQIRRAAANPLWCGWAEGAGEQITTPLFGYVWEYRGQVLGNVSLIPFHQDGCWYYLIANVAVHPDYRRQGIGHQLTLRAREHIRQRGARAWLQVREENDTAVRLYRSLGFIERYRRAQWESTTSKPPQPALPAGLKVQRRRWQDWPFQKEWLEQNYPAQIAWNLPLKVSRFAPNWLSEIWEWLTNGIAFRHWSLYAPHQLLGTITWEPSRTCSDSLWVAAPPANEDAVLAALLPRICREMQGGVRTLSVNFPAGRAGRTFQDAGFVKRQTLVWMESER